MKIVNDERKHELYNILKKMYKCADNNELEDYYRLKNIYLKLIKDIFSIDIGNQREDEEGFEWAATPNLLDTLFTYYNLYKDKPDKKDKYEEVKKKIFADFLKRIEKLKSYLT